MVSIENNRGCDSIVVGFTTTYTISALTTDVVSLISAQARCARYNIM